MADILIGTATTNQNGLAAFTGLPPGTYKYVQKSTKNGYVVDGEEYTIVITDATPVTAEHNNAPAQKGSITITKHVAGFPNYVLPGATFKLTDTDGKVLISESLVTDSSGSIVFDNLMTMTETPQSYQITEVTNPAGYEPNTEPYAVEVAVDQNFTQAVPNTPTVQGSLDIALKHTNYAEYGLPDAEYELYVVNE